MFSCCQPSLHSQYARKIRNSSTSESQKQTVIEYLLHDINDKKIPYFADANHPLVVELEKRHNQLQDDLDADFRALLTSSHCEVINKLKAPRPPLPVSEIVWEKLQAIGKKYDMSEKELFDLAYHLSNRDIRFVIDDSKSMETKDAKNPRGEVVSRWEALCERIEITVELATCLDPDGINLYFLNTEPNTVRNLNTVDMVRKEFQKRQPINYTPLRKAIERALIDGEEDKPLLIEIACDGASTDDIPPEYKYGPNDQMMTDEGPVICIPENSPYSASTRLEKVLNTRTPEGYSRSPKSDVRFGIMLCTKGSEVAWWNEKDKKIHGLDVNRCYEEENEEALKVTGQYLTYGRYQAKVLLGSIKSEYDLIDESKLSLSKRR